MKNIQWIIIALFMGLGVLNAQTVQNEITDGDYYMSKNISGDIKSVEETLRNVLKEEGFTVVTEISMHETLAEKLHVEFTPYRILGVCNAGYAYQTLQADENIGLFLPCKILLKQTGPEITEVVAINPSALMEMLGNKELMEIAKEVTGKFRAIMQKL
ncbi:MAG: DUF302 domain-containing protein [Bacteroidales bacterium]|nr:DUF302 domain-containing protein [Bacteroidales bacterium]